MRQKTEFVLALTLLVLCDFRNLANAQEAARTGLWRGVDYTGMDRTLDPKQDLDLYASAKWYEVNPIPPDQGSWSTGQLVKQRNQEVLRSILEGSARSTRPYYDPSRARLGAFYRSAMNVKQIDRIGLAPLKPLLAKLEKLRTSQQIWADFPRIYRQSADFAPISVYTEVDRKNPKQIDLVLGEGGLGLPNAHYYLRQDEKSKSLRAEYEVHMRRMFLLVGDLESKAALEAETILKFETRLAQAFRADANENAPEPIAAHQLDALCPGRSWRGFLARLGITTPVPILVNNPGFLREVSKMIDGESAMSWRSYFRWRFISSLAPTLSKPFAAEDFAFQRVLSGRIQAMPRWKQTVIWADELLGDDLGHIYVAQRFTPEARARAAVLVKNVVATLRDRINTLDWLSAQARQDMIQKLDHDVTYKIGYTDYWHDYAGLSVDDGPFVLNYLRAKRWAKNWEFARLGKPRNANERENTPQTINAYCDPITSEVVFSAGILQSPFFDPDAEDEVNYAQIGSVIGHELTHLFWWKGEDAAQFAERVKRIEERYSSYTLSDGTHVDGKLTLKENVADIGGLRLAFLAWKRSFAGKPQPTEQNGLTPEQRFFVAYAQSWRVQSRPEMARLRINSDPHAPGHFRIVGPVSYMPEFYHAFGTTARSPVHVPAGIW